MLLHETFGGRYAPMPRLTSFPNAKHLDELYLTGPIAVRSTCSHHLMPITGECWIGVIPGEEVIGLSKFNRLVDWVMSRGQIQEEATVQIADLLEDLLKPKGLAVVVKAQHHCMTHRGVKAHDDSVMTTSVMRGYMRDKPEARAEFLSLLR
jgi:GTP cyclohydrolase I